MLASVLVSATRRGEGEAVQGYVDRRGLGQPVIHVSLRKYRLTEARIEAVMLIGYHPINEERMTMSDNKKIYGRVLQALKKRMKGVPQKHTVRWSMMVAGIVMGKKAQLSAISTEIPSEAKDISTFRRLQRFVSDDSVDVLEHYMPFASQVLKALSKNELIFAIDGSQVGKGCMVLMIGVVYMNRLLPLTWLVYEGKKGHASAALHVQVLEQLLPLVPSNAKVSIVGDGEFDNIEMIKWIDENTNWTYALRTAKSTQIQCGEEQKRIECLAQRGEVIGLDNTFYTNQKYGPINVIAWWDEQYDEPIYLLTNIDDMDKVCSLYRMRPLIETLFSDQKSRGFGIGKSHLSDPKKVNRLLMATCLAYLWIVWLGTRVLSNGQIEMISHGSRCDKSLFRLGLDWLKHLLKHSKKFIVSFTIHAPLPVHTKWRVVV